MNEEPSLLDLLQRYETSVAKLGVSFENPELLDALLLRDAIERAILGGTVEVRRRVVEIVQTDRLLKGLPRSSFYKVRDALLEWRQSLTPSADAWWWFLDRALPSPLQRAERTILFFSVAIFPFSLGVAIELARLYGDDDAGIIGLLPLATSFLGSLSLAGVLSLSFRDRWTTFLEELGFGARLRALASCFIFVLLLFVVTLWFARPGMSKYYNEAGVAELTARNGKPAQLSAAQMKFERAVRFNQSNAVAHYNLGRVYEDLLDDDRAIAEYLIAFRAGLDLAGNNVGHLYLLGGQYDRAAFVLQKSMALSEKETANDRDLRYALLKNLGWARYGQTRLPEARHLLGEATQLEPDRADAHCLLAKTLEGMHDATAAKEWRECLGLTWHDSTEPAHETWTREAKAFLERER